MLGSTVACIHQLGDRQAGRAALQHGSVQLFPTEHAAVPDELDPYED
jgi:hypothetical protein